MAKQSLTLHTYRVHLIPPNMPPTDVEAAHDAGKLQSITIDAKNGETAMVAAHRETGQAAYSAERDDGTDAALDWLETDFDNAANELHEICVRRQGAAVLAKSIAHVRSAEVLA